MRKKVDLTIFKNLIMFFLFLILIAVLYKIQTVIIIFFGAFVIASAIEPLIDLFGKKFSRKISIILTGLSLILVLSIILFPLLNVIVSQIAQFIEQLPSYIQAGKLYTTKYLFTNPFIIKIFKHFGLHSSKQIFTNIGLSQNLSQTVNSFSSVGQTIVNGSLTVTTGIFTALSFLSISLILTVYLIFDRDNIKQKTLKLLPEHMRNQAENITTLISRRVSGFVIGQLIMMTIVGTMVTIGLLILGHKFPVATGTIAGLMDIIPFIGPMITTIVIVLSLLTQNPILALWGIILYMGIQWTTDTFIRPYIIGKFVDIHPLVLIFSLLSGAILFGIGGVIIAPLLALVFIVLIQELYVKKIN